MKKLLLIALLVTACDSSITSNNMAASRLTYFKDNRTGLCFAQVTSTTHSGWQVVSITNVPCSNVENNLIP